MSDKPQTFDAQIAEARERMNRYSFSDFRSFRSALRAFDVAVTVCEAEIAKKDAEIARLNSDRINEFAELDERYTNLGRECDRQQHIKEVAEDALAESRTVSNAQRRDMEDLIGSELVEARNLWKQFTTAKSGMRAT